MSWTTISLIAAAHGIVAAILLAEVPPSRVGKPPTPIKVELIAPDVPPKPLPPPRVVPRRNVVRPPVVELPVLAIESTRPSEYVVPIAPLPEPVEAVVPPAPLAAIVVAPVAIPVPVIPPRFDAAYLDNPPPVYPIHARRQREEGRVLLRVLVAADGRAERVDVAMTSGSERLDDAALDAVRRWRFVPAKRGDDAIAAYVNVPIVFSLGRA